jgi:hypothetical protein
MFFFFGIRGFWGNFIAMIVFLAIAYIFLHFSGLINM